MTGASRVKKRGKGGSGVIEEDDVASIYHQQWTIMANLRGRR